MANPAVVVFGGLGGIMFLEELRRGAVGTMTGFAFPEILVEIHRRHLAGDAGGAREVCCLYAALIRFENQPRINLSLRTHIYRLRGAIASETVRMPAFPLDRESMQELQDLLAHVGLPASD